MKEELMIGDIVMLNPDLKDFYEFAGKPCIVIGLNDDDGAIKIEYDQGKWFWTDAEDDVEGIKITPEILEKNGFKFNPFSIGFYEYKSEYGNVSCGFDTDCWLFYVNDCVIPNHFHYVHQLQHALKLCGIEKEIKI